MMDVRRGVGGVGVIPRVAAVLAAIALLVFAGLQVPAADAQSRQRPALDYHATVLNGRVIGSAFSIADGLAVTNAHVVRGLAQGEGLWLVGRGGARTEARLLAVSDYMDLAVVRVPSGALPIVSKADAPERAGISVVAAGVDATGTKGPGPRMALSGRVLDARTHVPAFGPGLIAQVPGVRPGFSGGPLLDRHGRLVGMVTAIRPGRAPAAAASGFAPRQARASGEQEAFVLRARAVRSETARLLSASGF